MVHPYRVRNSESIQHSFKDGRMVINFAKTIDDFMTQFYTFKSFLVRIGFLDKESQFAFNLSNIKGHNLPKTKSHFFKNLP